MSELHYPLEDGFYNHWFPNCITIGELRKILEVYDFSKTNKKVKGDE